MYTSNPYLTQKLWSTRFAVPHPETGCSQVIEPRPSDVAATRSAAAWRPSASASQRTRPLRHLLSVITVLQTLSCGNMSTACMHNRGVTSLQTIQSNLTAAKSGAICGLLTTRDRAALAGLRAVSSVGWAIVGVRSGLEILIEGGGAFGSSTGVGRVPESVATEHSVPRCSREAVANRDACLATLTQSA